MRFSFAEGMTHAEYYAPLAQAAEAAGYTSMTIADSLIYPKESDSKYPYTDTGDREFLDGKEFIETMILCAHLFAVTTTLAMVAWSVLPVSPLTSCADAENAAAMEAKNAAIPAGRAAVLSEEFCLLSRVTMVSLCCGVAEIVSTPFSERPPERPVSFSNAPKASSSV